MMNFAWATEQSQISPGAKLLALYLANYSGMRSEMEVVLQDPAAWCNCGVEQVDSWFHELEKKARLQVARRWDNDDKYMLCWVVRIPEAINGGKLI